jgi:hypothetical protein
VQAFASSVGAGTVDNFVGRAVTNCRTNNEPLSYFGVDLGEGRKLVPTAYTIRNRNSTTHVIMNWRFEGSNDKVSWVAVDTRIHMPVFDPNNKYENIKEIKDLKVSGGSTSYAIDMDNLREVGQEGFRYFRILQVDKNSSGSDNLALSGFELYGKVTSGRWP